MLAAKERYYQKLKDNLLKVDILSSDPVRNAEYMKQQNEKLYLKQVAEIEDYLLNQIKKGDNIAYSLYKVAHEEELSRIPELNDWDKIKYFLETHTDLTNPDNDPFFSPKVIYYAEVLGAQEQLEEHHDHP